MVRRAVENGVCVHSGGATSGARTAGGEAAARRATIAEGDATVRFHAGADQRSAVELFQLGAAVGALSTINMNLSYLFRMEYSTGDKLHTAARLAETVVGTMENPGEIGGHGFNIDQGASVQLGLTPLIDDLRIDITLVCLEMRGPRNFSSPGRY